MNKLNFEKLKSITTPDEWLENAVNIPNRKNVVPFYRHTSFLASAVCVALCMIVGVIMIFKIMPEKIPISDNSDVKTLSTNAASENSDIPTTTPDAALQSSTPQDNSEHNEQVLYNYRGRGTTQTVTEPSERSTDKSTTLTTQATANNASQGNRIPSSNGEENQTATTVNSNVPDTDSMEETQQLPSDSENTSATIPGDKPNPQPEQSEPTSESQVDESTIIFTMPIYLHINSISGFDYDNTVGCHMKKVGGEDLYPYNSVYEKCEYDDSSSGWEVDSACIEYKNKGPNDITFGLYEITFYDTEGKIITQKVNISGNNSVHIFI